MFKRRNYTWNDGKSLSLCDRTLIMGILNGTPDSFSDGGKFNTPEAAAAHVTQMINDGADIIDLGVESTRPGCTPLTADEEIERLSQLIDPVLHASTAGLPSPFLNFQSELILYLLILLLPAENASLSA